MYCRECDEAIDIDLDVVCEECYSSVVSQNRSLRKTLMEYSERIKLANEVLEGQMLLFPEKI